MLSLVVLVVAVMLAPHPEHPAGAGRQREQVLIPVGVRYHPGQDPAGRRTALETLRRLRFNVVAAAPDARSQTTALIPITQLLAGETGDPITLPSSELGVVTVSDAAAGGVRERAWTLLAHGKRGIIFDDWPGLQRHASALTEAAAFAEEIGRNIALYAPLRRADKSGPRALRIDGGPGLVEAEWLESDEAFLLVAINHAAAPQQVTLRFALDMPEAIWQNMLTGAAVNFVAGPEGPTYTRVFDAHDVLLLMIRKRWREP